MPKEVSSFSEFLFGEPLYAECDLTSPDKMNDLLDGVYTVDGHCIHCRKFSTFSNGPGQASGSAFNRV
jgi:hypothetical protein